jgi:hypothetical protein
MRRALWAWRLRAGGLWWVARLLFRRANLGIHKIMKYEALYQSYWIRPGMFERIFNWIARYTLKQSSESIEKTEDEHNHESGTNPRLDLISLEDAITCNFLCPK